MILGKFENYPSFITIGGLIDFHENDKNLPERIYRGKPLNVFKLAIMLTPTPHVETIKNNCEC